MRQDSDLTPLSDSVGYVLKQATTALHAAMEGALRPIGLTLSQYSCLEQLSRTPDQSNAQLARAVFVTPQSMNDVLRGLQSRGLVQRPTNAESGRARPTRLTPEGERSVRAARSVIGPVETRLLDAMSESDQRRILLNLRAIIGALAPDTAQTN